MDAPIRTGKWSNFCYQLANASTEEFNKRIPQALDKLNAKVCSLYAECRDSEECKESLRRLNERVCSILQNCPKLKDKQLKLVTTLEDLERGRGSASSIKVIDEINDHFPKPRDPLFLLKAKGTICYILKSFHEVGSHLTKPTELRRKLVELIHAAHALTRTPKEHECIGHVLRPLIRKVEQLAPGLMSDEVRSYDERTFKICIGDKIVRVAPELFDKFSQDCAFIEIDKEKIDECRLDKSINVNAFKEMLRWYSLERFEFKTEYPIDFDMLDEVKVAIALGNDKRLKNILRPHNAAFSCTTYDDTDAKRGYVQFVNLIKVARETQNPIVYETLEIDMKLFLRWISEADLSNEIFKLLARHDLPAPIALALVVRIDELIEQEKRIKGNPLILWSDRIIETLRAWYTVVAKEKLPHENEHLSWAIQKVLFTSFGLQTIPVMMEKFKKAFPEFEQEFELDAVMIGEVEKSKESKQPPSFKLDLSEAKEGFPYEVLKLLRGWNISELTFYKTTPEIEKLRALLPTTTFKFVEQPAPAAPSTLAKATGVLKSYLTGF